MRRFFLAVAMLVATSVTGCVRDTGSAINGPDPSHRTTLPGTGPTPTACPADPTGATC